jgi:TolB-like protein
VPTVCVEAFAAAPNDQETTVVADDLRDQLIQRLSRRTGIRV